MGGWGGDGRRRARGETPSLPGTHAHVPGSPIAGVHACTHACTCIHTQAKECSHTHACSGLICSRGACTQGCTRAHGPWSGPRVHARAPTRALTPGRALPRLGACTCLRKRTPARAAGTCPCTHLPRHTRMLIHACPHGRQARTHTLTGAHAYICAHTRTPTFGQFRVTHTAPGPGLHAWRGAE